MRKITLLAAKAFYGKQTFKQANTEVYYSESQDVSSMFLHGSLIAKYHHGDKLLQVTNGGFFTNVTKERLNGLIGVRVSQRDFVWYLNGESWDGELTTLTV